MSIRDNMRKKSQKAWDGAKYAGIGFEFGLSIALCTYVGSKIDTYFESDPICVVVGVFFGFTVGLRGLMKIAKKEQARFEQLKHTFPAPDTDVSEETTLQNDPPSSYTEDTDSSFDSPFIKEGTDPTSNPHHLN